MPDGLTGPESQVATHGYCILVARASADPAALPNLDALQTNVDLQQTLGFVFASVDVTKNADFSVTKEAAAQLAAGQ